MPRLSNKVVSTEKGKMGKYYEGELVILLVYRRGLKRDLSVYVSWLKEHKALRENSKLWDSKITANPPQLCPND